MKIFESLSSLLSIAASPLDQWAGNLFYRKVSPSEIKAMTFHELKYWNDWHEKITQAEVDANKPKG